MMYALGRQENAKHSEYVIFVSCPQIEEARRRKEFLRKLSRATIGGSGATDSHWLHLVFTAAGWHNTRCSLEVHNCNSSRIGTRIATMIHV